MALSQMEKGVEGYIYSLHTKSNQYTHLTDVGGAEWLNSVALISGTTWWDRLEQLGRTDVLRRMANHVSVAPIASIR